MDPVVHFEMSYRNGKRLAEFYESAFGWRMRDLGKPMGNYVLATTVETGAKGPKRPGAINGGFYPRGPKGPAPCPSLTIAVEDIKKAVKKVKAAGGKLLGKPFEIPGVGQYAVFTDTEGNRATMLQPIPRNWHGEKE